MLWDSEKMAEVEVDAKTYAFYNQATKADAASASGNIDPRIAPARRMLPMIKHISQGYFCQHRAMNSEALRVFNRCFSVCISCATSQHNTYFVSPTVAVATADPNEPGHLDRRVLPLRQDEYTVRLNKIELDFKDKCFSTNALTRGAPVGTRWDSIVDASLAAITRFGWTPIPQEGGLHHMLDGGAALGGLSIEALETPVHLSADEIENELMMGTPEFTGAIGTFPTFARSQNYYLNEVIPDLVNPALSRHAHSKNDGFLRVIELREKTKKKLKMTFEGGLDTLRVGDVLPHVVMRIEAGRTPPPQQLRESELLTLLDAHRVGAEVRSGRRAGRHGPASPLFAKRPATTPIRPAIP